MDEERIPMEVQLAGLGSSHTQRSADVLMTIKRPNEVAATLVLGKPDCDSCPGTEASCRGKRQKK